MKRGAEHSRVQRKGRERDLQTCQICGSKGYHILDRNWRSGHKEIDIVAEKGGVLVSV